MCLIKLEVLIPKVIIGFLGGFLGFFVVVVFLGGVLFCIINTFFLVPNPIHPYSNVHGAVGHALHLEVEGGLLNVMKHSFPFTLGCSVAILSCKVR